MKAILCAIVLLSCIFLLGACTASDPATSPVPPTPTDSPLPSAYVIPPSEPPVYTVGDRNVACAPEVDYGPEDYQRYDWPLLWTFQINFNVTSDSGETSGLPTTL